ncbi:MAG: HEAT repeat domain-containing protein [Methanoregula sp.]|nr:HEAT repeat domain-containing protein [Methanoregula sp.]
MAVNAVRMADEWFSHRQKTDRTGRLIEKVLADRSTEERMRAITELGSSRDHAAAGLLIDCCHDQDPEIRRSAIIGLQNLRSGRAVSVLIDRLRDKDELRETRQHAASALAAIRSYRAIQELRSRYADTDEDSALRFFIGRELDRVHILVSPSHGPVPSF